MGRTERKVFWIVIGTAAALVFAYEFLFMPMSILKVIVCVAALVVIGFAFFKQGRHRMRI